MIQSWTVVRLSLPAHSLLLYATVAIRRSSKGTIFTIEQSAPPPNLLIIPSPKTQAEKFVLNVEDDSSTGYTALGGHGFDGTLACGLVRCSKYDDTYVTNLGTRFGYPHHTPRWRWRLSVALQFPWAYRRGSPFRPRLKLFIVRNDRRLCSTCG